ncbi:MAG TPA: PQQ-binding-like beta-propeller repeat protein, partial [Candidatus Melainabacteria bacterium]|nr:PQQ-binding-like beta-propeller repeat protein [Candidatus Melainabacteria bacterium]
MSLCSRLPKLFNLAYVAGFASLTCVALCGSSAFGQTPLEGAAVHNTEASSKPSREELLKGSSSIVSQYGNSWSMFLQNSCHTGKISLGAAFQPIGKLKWTFPAEGPIDSSPAIYKGVVYVGSDDHFVYAVDERNGRMLWKTELGDKVKSSPAVTDQILVIGCEDHKVYGIDPKTGSIKWSVQTADRVSSSPAILNGVAFFGGWGGYVYAGDINSG